MDTTEFHVRINGLKLPLAAKTRIEEEIQKLVKRELAKLDLKGDLSLPKDRMFGATAGMVADWKQ